MLTSVDDVIAQPREQWMVFWFPLALLISYRAILARDARASGVGRKSTAGFDSRVTQRREKS